MPYSIREVDGQFCVYKKDEQLKCYDEKSDALAYLGALESNTDYDKVAKALARVAKYGAVLSGVNKREITAAVQSLITVLRRAGIELEGDTMDEKALIEQLKQLDPETAQQLADMVNEFVGNLDSELGITEAIQGQEQPVDEDGNPVEEDPNAEKKPEGERQAPEKEPAAETDAEGNPKKKPPYKSLKERVQALFTPEERDGGVFQVFKGVDGHTYWLARHTNNFEDRDKEILSGKAHDAYIARISVGLVDKPELWVWHAKGSSVGQADMVWRHEHFMFALGHFADDPIAQRAAKSLAKRQGKLELSHGFTYPSWALKNGVYSTYNTFEISVLPEGMAANPYTSFEEIKAMALTDKQRQWIKETGGDDMLARVERVQAEAEKDGDVLKALDKRYKDFGDAIQDNGTDTMQVDLKQVLKVVAELIEAQGTLEASIEAANVETVAQKTAREKAEAEVKAVRAEMDDIRAQLKMRPRSAARASETDIEGDNALKEALKKVTEGDYEEHPVWGRLKPKA